MKKTVIFFVLAMVVIGSCAAQSANDAQRIVGTWVSTDGKTTCVFNANGTGTWAGENIFYGISSTGELYMMLANGSDRDHSTLYMSPDGRRMIYDGEVFQKK